MTPTSPNRVPSSLENDENIIDSTGVSVDYKHLIEVLNSFFDTKPFGRKIIKISSRKAEKLRRSLKYSSIRVKKVEYYRPLAFVTVMSESITHSMMTNLVAHEIVGALHRVFPQERYGNQANMDIISPQGIITKPDAQFYPEVRRERMQLPTVVVEVGVNETKIDLLRDVSDLFTIQGNFGIQGDFAIEVAVTVQIKLGSRNTVDGPRLLNKKFTGAIFESYLRVVRADATRDGRQEGWRELVQRESMESTVILDGDHIALDADPIDIKFSVLVNHEGHDQAITVPANLVNPDAENDEDIVLLNEDNIIQITEDVLWAHEVGVARARAP